MSLILKGLVNGIASKSSKHLVGFQIHRKMRLKILRSIRKVPQHLIQITTIFQSLTGVGVQVNKIQL